MKSLSACLELHGKDLNPGYVDDLYNYINESPDIESYGLDKVELWAVEDVIKDLDTEEKDIQKQVTEIKKQKKADKKKKSTGFKAYVEQQLKGSGVQYKDLPDADLIELKLDYDALTSFNAFVKRALYKTGIRRAELSKEDIATLSKEFRLQKSKEPKTVEATRYNKAGKLINNVDEYIDEQLKGTKFRRQDLKPAALKHFEQEWKALTAPEKHTGITRSTSRELAEKDKAYKQLLKTKKELEAKIRALYKTVQEENEKDKKGNFIDDLSAEHRNATKRKFNTAKQRYKAIQTEIASFKEKSPGSIRFSLRDALLSTRDEHVAAEEERKNKQRDDIDKPAFSDLEDKYAPLVEEVYKSDVIRASEIDAKIEAVAKREGLSKKELQEFSEEYDKKLEEGFDINDYVDVRSKDPYIDRDGKRLPTSAGAENKDIQKLGYSIAREREDVMTPHTPDKPSERRSLTLKERQAFEQIQKAARSDNKLKSPMAVFGPQSKIEEVFEDVKNIIVGIRKKKHIPTKAIPTLFRQKLDEFLTQMFASDRREIDYAKEFGEYNEAWKEGFRDFSGEKMTPDQYRRLIKKKVLDLFKKDPHIRQPYKDLQKKLETKSYDELSNEDLSDLYYYNSREIDSESLPTGFTYTTDKESAPETYDEKLDRIKAHTEGEYTETGTIRQGDKVLQSVPFPDTKALKDIPREYRPEHDVMGPKILTNLSKKGFIKIIKDKDGIKRWVPVDFTPGKKYTEVSKVDKSVIAKQKENIAEKYERLEEEYYQRAKKQGKSSKEARTLAIRAVAKIKATDSDSKSSQKSTSKTKTGKGTKKKIKANKQAEIDPDQMFKGAEYAETPDEIKKGDIVAKTTGKPFARKSDAWGAVTRLANQIVNKKKDLTDKAAKQKAKDSIKSLWIPVLYKEGYVLRKKKVQDNLIKAARARASRKFQERYKDKVPTIRINEQLGTRYNEDQPNDYTVFDLGQGTEVEGVGELSSDLTYEQLQALSAEDKEAVKKLEERGWKFAWTPDNKVGGFYANGRIYLIKENLKTPQDLLAVFKHEAFHLLVDKDPNFRKLYKGLLKDIHKKLKTDPKLKAIYEEVKETYPNQEDWLEETLAKYVESEANVNLPWYKEIVSKIKVWIAKTFNKSLGIGGWKGLSGYDLGKVVEHHIRRQLDGKTVTTKAESKGTKSVEAQEYTNAYNTQEELARIALKKIYPGKVFTKNNRPRVTELQYKDTLSIDQLAQLSHAQQVLKYYGDKTNIVSYISFDQAQKDILGHIEAGADLKFSMDKAEHDVTYIYEESKDPEISLASKLYRSLLAPVFYKSKIKGPERKKEKQDTSWLNRVFGSSEWDLRKDPASVRVLEPAKNEDSNRTFLETELTGAFHDRQKEIAKEKGKPFIKKVMKKVNSYMLKVDETGKGYRPDAVLQETSLKDSLGVDIRTTVTHYVVKDRQGKAIKGLKFSTRKQALKKAYDLEAMDLKNRGFNKEAREMIRITREALDRTLDVLIEDLRKVDATAKKHGLKPKTHRLTMKNGKVQKVSTARAIIEMGNWQGTYFPRIRPQGGFTLHAKKGNRKIEKNFSTHLIPNELSLGLTNKVKSILGRLTPIERYARRLEKEGWTYSIAESKRPTSAIFDMPKLLASMDAVLGKAVKEGQKDTNEASQKALNTMFNQITGDIGKLFDAQNSLASRTARQKDYWEGFETDINLAVTNYIQATAAAETRKQTVRSMVLAFTGRDISYDEWIKRFNITDENANEENYRKFARARAIDPVKQKKLWEDTQQFISYFAKPDNAFSKAIGVLRTVAVLKYLGWRVSSAAVNMTNMATGVIGTMSAKTNVGLIESWKLIGHAADTHIRYQTEIGRKAGKHNQSAKVTDEERRVYSYISSHGFDAPLYNSEAIAAGQQTPSRIFNAISKSAMLMFGFTEKINRTLTIKASFDAIRQSKPGFNKKYDKLNADYDSSNKHLSEQAFEKLMLEAKQISDDAHASYNKASRPWLVQKYEILNIPYTFMKFTHNYMLNMYNVGFNDGQIKEMLYLIMAPGFLAGAGASAATPVLNMMFSKIWDDPEEEFYGYVERTLGSDTLARTGVIGALTGFSFRNNLEPNIPSFNTPIEMLGAPANVFVDIANAINHWRYGEGAKGFEDALPSVFSNMVKAKREYKEGLTTEGYQPKFYGDSQVKSTEFEFLLRFLSLTPNRIQKISDKQWSDKKKRAKYAKMRKSILREYKHYFVKPLQDRNIERLYTLAIRRQHYNEQVSELNPNLFIPYATDTWLKRNLKAAFSPSKQERYRQK